MRNYKDATIRCCDCGMLMIGVATNRKRCESCNKALETSRNKKRKTKRQKAVSDLGLTEVVREADKAGMSYGQYVAKQKLEEKRDV